MQAINYSTGGSKARGTYEQLRGSKKNLADTSVKSMIIHVGINHLSSDNPMDVTSKICRLMFYGSKELLKTSIYFWVVLLTFGRSFNSKINYVNDEFFNFC